MLCVVYAVQIQQVLEDMNRAGVRPTVAVFEECMFAAMHYNTRFKIFNEAVAIGVG